MDMLQRSVNEFLDQECEPFVGTTSISTTPTVTTTAIATATVTVSNAVASDDVASDAITVGDQKKSDADSGGLSTEAIIGVGAVACIVVVACAALIYMKCSKKTLTGQSVPPPEGTPQTEATGPPVGNALPKAGSQLPVPESADPLCCTQVKVAPYPNEGNVTGVEARE